MYVGVDIDGAAACVALAIRLLVILSAAVAWVISFAKSLGQGYSIPLVLGQLHKP